MIKDVKKIAEGKYMLNECVLIHNFNYEDHGISYSTDYDETAVTKKEAEDLCEEFISKSIQHFKISK